MAKANGDPKTAPIAQSVADFIASVEPAAKSEDAAVLDALFRKVTGAQPTIWAGGIIGYCDDAAAKDRAGFLEKLGKHKTGASCLYINKLADVDLTVLEQMIAADLSRRLSASKAA